MQWWHFALYVAIMLPVWWRSRPKDESRREDRAAATQRAYRDR